MTMNAYHPQRPLQTSPKERGEIASMKVAEVSGDITIKTDNR
jgi:hypothetical protein